MKRRDFLKSLGIGIAYACAPIGALKFGEVAGRVSELKRTPISEWTSITDGCFCVSIDGEPAEPIMLDFTGLDSIEEIEQIIKSCQA